MNRTAADVEREVEASRSDLDRTVEALKDKMTPGQIFDEASRAMGGAGQQVLSKFVEQAKENPMPLAVMGLGLAWLMSGAGKSGGGTAGGSAAGYAEPRSFAERGKHGANVVSDLGSGLGEKVHAVGDKASGVIAGAKDKLSSAASTVGGSATSVAGKVGAYGHQAQRGFAQLLESEPLLIGAAGLLVGAAIGAALPHTDLEDRTVGPARDKLLEKGKDLAHDGLQHAGDVAQAAYGSVKDELQKPPPEGSDPVQRAGDIAQGAVQAGRQALENPPN
jgi:hypothetical protein